MMKLYSVILGLMLMIQPVLSSQDTLGGELFQETERVKQEVRVVSFTLPQISDHHNIILPDESASRLKYGWIEVESIALVALGHILNIAQATFGTYGMFPEGYETLWYMSSILPITMGVGLSFHNKYLIQNYCQQNRIDSLRVPINRERLERIHQTNFAPLFLAAASIALYSDSSLFSGLVSLGVLALLGCCYDTVTQMVLHPERFDDHDLMTKWQDKYSVKMEKRGVDREDGAETPHVLHQLLREIQKEKQNKKQNKKSNKQG